MKRVFTFILCLLMMTGTAAAQSDVYWEGSGATCGDNLSWYLDGATLYISGSGDMYDFITGAPWADYKGTITQVILSDGVTSVGAYAFQDYDSLISVSFGNSLVSIGKDAFSGCDGLTSVTLPASFRKFGENCFRSCKNLTQIFCSGNFPRFDENCLWDTYATIVYSASNPWSVSLIAQLESAFSNRIEFRSSDGTDPYTPTEAAEVTEAPTQETFWVTEPTEVTIATEPATLPAATEPTAAATQPVPTETAAAAQPTIVLATEMASVPTYSSGSATGGSSIFAFLLIVIVLAILATGALLVHTAGRGRRKKKHRYRR